MVLRTAASVETEIYAAGLDVGGSAIEVAQRGFSSMLSNRMSQLGGWDFDAPRSTLRLADDLVAHLLDREGSLRFGRAAVGVACPVWFGTAERHHLAGAIDPGHRHTLVACTTTTAVAVGTNLGADEPLEHEFVLALDFDIGFSASIVEVGRGVVREWCAVGLSPRQLRGEPSRSGIVPGTRQRDRALAALFRDAGVLGCLGVRRVVSAGGEEASEIERMLAGIHEGWAECPIETVRSRADVARGAAFLADPIGGARVFGIDPDLGGSIDDAVVPSDDPAACGHPDEAAGASQHPHHTPGPRRGWMVSGCLGRSIGVLLEEPDGGAVVHPVLDRLSRSPVSCEQPFDLGPDDGTDVYLDLYEQHPLATTGAPSDHRVIATAKHRRSSRRRPDVAVSFAVNADGRFEVGPAAEWTTEWRDAEVAVVAAPRSLIDAHLASDRRDRSTVRALVPPATEVVMPDVDVPDVDVAVTEAMPDVVVPEVAVSEADVVVPDVVVPDVVVPDVVVPDVVVPDVVVPDVVVPDVDAPEADEPEADAPEADAPDAAEADVAGADVAEAMPDVVVADMVPGRDPPLSVPASGDRPGSSPRVAAPAIAGALQRCERLLSYEVGRMVAVRSVFALVDCDDGAPREQVRSRAARLARAVADRDDDVAAAVQLAVTAIEAMLTGGGDGWYFGGSAADVDRELSLVIEHLMLVVGFVSGAELRRLVYDAQLLGLSPARAIETVRSLVANAQADRSLELVVPDDNRCRIVRWHPMSGRFVLDDSSSQPGLVSTSGPSEPDVVTLRVLLDGV